MNWTINRLRATPEVGHLLLIAAVGAYTSWYLYDVVSASSAVRNLLFIVPVGIFILGLCAVLAVQSVLAIARGDLDADEDQSPDAPAEAANPRMPVIMAGLFAAYILAMAYTGFDVATFAYIAACLWVQGERNVPLVLIYAVGFAAMLTYGFRSMIPYPFETLIL